MKVEYRQAFLKDLKNLKSSLIFHRIFEIAFTTIPNAESLEEISNIKAMQRISKPLQNQGGRLSDCIEVYDDFVEVIRTLHRKDFYRYFP